MKLSKLSKLWMGLLVLIPCLSMADANVSIPITQYVAALPSQTSAVISSTSLNHTYLPIVGGTFGLNTTASRNISESYSYPQTPDNSGGGSTGFSLSVLNSTGSTVYVYIQGSANGSSWAQACPIQTNSDGSSGQTGMDYVDNCVGLGGINLPGNPNFTVYVAQSTFSSSATFASATHFLTCTASASGASYDLTKNTFTLTASAAYQLALGEGGSCLLVPGS